MRTLRLGWGRRLRAVDPAGRLGLVSGWYGRFRLVELERGKERAIGLKLPRRDVSVSPIAAGGRVVWPVTKVVRYGGRNRLLIFRGLSVASLSAGTVELVENRGATEFHVPIRIRLSRGGEVAWFLTRSETVRMWHLGRDSQHEYTPLPGAVIQSADFDDQRGLLAAASYGYAAVLQVGDGELQECGRVRIPNTDNPWIALVGGRLFVLSNYRGRRGHELRGFVLDDDGVPAREPFFCWSERTGFAGDGQSRPIQRPIVADVSGDARWVAIALNDRRVAIYQPDACRAQYLTGHSDDIAALRFTAGAASLISGDYDNRVIARPRVGESFLVLARRRR